MRPTTSAILVLLFAAFASAQNNATRVLDPQTCVKECEVHVLNTTDVSSCTDTDFKAVTQCLCSSITLSHLFAIKLCLQDNCPDVKTALEDTCPNSVGLTLQKPTYSLASSLLFVMTVGMLSL
ncbi:hypothetical protein EXIGLDRAFT_747175 [Exidia glandulosa HHB12029]|uniref:Extracellular membrane protein CFEM domain-containing protein n=1 Tax=Exidia glandulosa HHB12029 TaxID=1314781 RepID=A0A165L2Z2_EXIGL|nr:hypothetical protein EXIGLDRAFT_747175 [Exidia glandulosa HHB12029]